MFLALIIFRLEIPLIKRKEKMNWQTIRKERSINDKDNFWKVINLKQIYCYQLN